jgi:WD40 repeat protein
VVVLNSVINSEILCIISEDLTYLKMVSPPFCSAIPGSMFLTQTGKYYNIQYENTGELDSHVILRVGSLALHKGPDEYPFCHVRWQGHRKWITGVAWEPAHLQVPCRRFASASKDGDVRIWDTVLQKSVLCLSGHTLAVTCVKWSGDGFIFSG